MKLKLKGLSTVLLIIMLIGSLSGTALGADTVEFVNNGDFESFDKEGNPTYWAFYKGNFGTEFALDKKDFHGGENSLRMKADGNLHAAQSVSGIVGGTEYELSAWLKVISADGRGAGTKLDLFDAGGKPIEAESQKTNQFYTDVNKNSWTRISYKFTAPENAVKAVLLIRLWDKGEILWDDVSLKGAGTGTPKPAEPQKPEAPITPQQPSTVVIKKPLEGSVNLVENGNFEKLDANGGAEGWFPYQNSWKNLVTIVNEEGRGNILKLTSVTERPWARFAVMNVIPGTEYQVKALLKTISFSGDGPAFKAEFYKDKPNADCWVGQRTGKKLPATGGKWEEVADQFVVPEGANLLCVYARLYGQGEIYYDDIEVKEVTKAPRMLLKTRVFYYTEWDRADVDVIFRRQSYPDLSGTIEFRLTDGGALLNSDVLTVNGQDIKYKFDVELLREKGKGYLLTAVYKDAAGNVLQTESEEIFRYDRPSRLTEDGLFKAADGNLVVPVMGYHTDERYFKEMAAAGINVLQSKHGGTGDYATPLNIPFLIKFMDDAWYNHGMMTAVVLYHRGVPAADPKAIEETKAAIEAVKDHPGLFGYMVQDEPFAHMHMYDRKSKEEIYDLLKLSYRTIRDMDPEHPVYLCECEYEFYEWASNCVDILGIDPYPYTTEIGTKVYHWAAKASAASEYKKPVINIMQAWPYMGYDPTANDVRQMMYQGFFAKNEALGYYDVVSWDGTPHLWERALYSGIECMEQGEIEDTFKAFITGEYPTLTELCSTSEGNWYKAYVKDGSVYVAVINVDGKTGEVSIPLVSADKEVSIGNFKAEAADISGAPDISGSGTLKVQITAPYQAIRYKVTPMDGTDLSLVTGSKFNDLGDYAWAKAAIDKLANLNIANSVALRQYGPGEKITRADFAMFLIKTLGLTSDSTENFADVKENAYYAKALATGKALGILKGVGEDKFNPYAEISRQDLMVICARGMRLVKALEEGDANALNEFPDVDKIAGYAAADVAAMVRAMIVRGNEDGSINPIGNTTRAEAAVIMSRILDWRN